MLRWVELWLSCLTKTFYGTLTHLLNPYWQSDILLFSCPLFFGQSQSVSLSACLPVIVSLVYYIHDGIFIVGLVHSEYFDNVSVHSSFGAHYSLTYCSWCTKYVVRWLQYLRSIWIYIFKTTLHFKETFGVRCKDKRKVVIYSAFPQLCSVHLCSETSKLT